MKFVEPVLESDVYGGAGSEEGPEEKNFWVGVEGRGVSTGVLRVPGLRYSSATITTSLPPIAEERFRISSFSSCGQEIIGRP